LVRRAQPPDAAAVADVLIRSRAAADIPPSVHDDADVRRWVAQRLLPDDDVWVAVTDGGTVVGVLALAPGWVEQLYVAPGWTGRGVGSALLRLAQQLQPGGLQLWVFESNVRAQHFYQGHGFLVVERTEGAGNEEGAPDVRYRWDPAVGPAVGPR
jgi:ribosomal protein S18 acetylase RimI-like enzyme